MPTGVQSEAEAGADAARLNLHRRGWILSGAVAVLVVAASVVVLIERHGSAEQAQQVQQAADSMILGPPAATSSVGQLRQLSQHEAPPRSAGQQASWSLVAASSDSRVVRVAWVGGDPPSCVGADTALVTEEPARVIIQLIDHPTVDQCNADAVRWLADVTLSSPLGDRALLEYGAPGH